MEEFEHHEGILPEYRMLPPALIAAEKFSTYMNTLPNSPGFPFLSWMLVSQLCDTIIC